MSQTLKQRGKQKVTLHIHWCEGALLSIEPKSTDPANIKVIRAKWSIMARGANIGISMFKGTLEIEQHLRLSTDGVVEKNGKILTNLTRSSSRIHIEFQLKQVI